MYDIIEVEYLGSPEEKIKISVKVNDKEEWEKAIQDKDVAVDSTVSGDNEFFYTCTMTREDMNELKKLDFVISIQESHYVGPCNPKPKTN